MTIEYSDSHTDGFFRRRPLSLRTGSKHDEDGTAGDTESGGQVSVWVRVSVRVRSRVRVRVS
jgi:hypothetical protein